MVAVPLPGSLVTVTPAACAGRARCRGSLLGHAGGPTIGLGLGLGRQCPVALGSPLAGRGLTVEAPVPSH